MKLSVSPYDYAAHLGACSWQSCDAEAVGTNAANGELVTELADIWSMDGEQIILLALSLIDLSLTSNLLLIVIFAGYENFVSKIHVGER